MRVVSKPLFHLNWFVFLTSIVVVTGCSGFEGRDQFEEKLITTTAKRVKFEEVDYIRVSDFADSVSYLVMDSEDDLIGVPFKVLKHDSKYYLGDKSGDAIYVFSDSGTLLSKVSAKGDGPGEYSQLSDFSIDRITNDIIVFSRSNQTVYRYESTGNFKSKLVLGHYLEAIFPFSQSEFITYASSNDYLQEELRPSGISLLSNDNNQLDNVNLYHFAGDLASYNHKQNVYLSQGVSGLHILTVSDTVFTFDKSGLFAAFVIDLGSKNIPQELRGLSNLPANTEKIKQGDYLRSRDYFIEKEKIMAFTFSDNSYEYWAYASPDSARGAYSKSIVNDLGDFPVSFPTSVADDRLVSVLGQEEIISVLGAMDQQKAELIKYLGISEYERRRSYMDSLQRPNITILCLFDLKD